MGGKKPSREEIAWKEIGTTAIGRNLAVGLSVFFLITVFLVPLGQYALDLQHGTSVSFVVPSGGTGSREEGVFAVIERRNNNILESIHRLENSLEEGSFLRKIYQTMPSSLRCVI